MATELHKHLWKLYCDVLGNLNCCRISEKKIMPFTADFKWYQKSIYLLPLLYLTTSPPPPYSYH